MIKLTFFFLLIACSTTKLPKTAQVSEREFPSPQEARNYVKNRFNYLHLLFEQSYDPYYGTPKWGPECLADNHIGKIQEKEGRIWFVSRLVLNKSGDVGFCEGTKRESILLHCSGENKTYEIFCLPDECASLISCPLIQSDGAR